MYAWDRFTMSLVLMYSKPTWEQTRAVEGLAAGHLQPAPAPGTGTSTCAHGVGPLATGSSGFCPSLPDRRPAPGASASRAAGAGRGQGPKGGCAPLAPQPAAGAAPWCPGGTAARRRRPRQPPAGTGSGTGQVGVSSGSHRRAPELRASGVSQPPTQGPAHPEHGHILDPQLFPVFPRARSALQVEQEPGGAVDSDVRHHGERVPVRTGAASAWQPTNHTACGPWEPLAHERLQPSDTGWPRKPPLASVSPDCTLSDDLHP